ncbi:unnamed protein product [Clonostachys solani]|uniref:C2H2-type domain-containing protein n=1 Tax=Clonostachys solani TaxID=160281 RepID=A0A9N9ZEV8_9HYPO|nr:unnamed protein product [Clonostachys solani]
MPWAIPAALAVLWGVCWMFWPPLHHSVPGDFNHDPQVPDPSRNGLNVASEFDDIDSEYHAHAKVDCDLPRPVNQISTEDIDISQYDLTPQIFNYQYTDWAGTVSDIIPSDEFKINTQADNPVGSFISMSSNTEATDTTSSEMSHNLGRNKGSSYIPSTTSNINPTCGSSERIAEFSTFTVDVSSTTKKFTCLDCGEGFTRASTLQRHQTEKHNNNAEMFPCPNTGCRRSDLQNAFKRAAHLTRHLKSCKKQPEGQGSYQAGSSEQYSAYQTDISHTSTSIDEYKEAEKKRKATDEEDLSTNTGEQVIDFLQKKRRQLLAEAEAGEKRARAQREEATKLAECIRCLEGDNGDGAGI